MSLAVEKSEDLLYLNLFHADESLPHIAVDDARCALCATRPCLTICPAEVFTALPDGRIQVSCAGCLECGTCEIVCPQGLEKWCYPRGGFGIVYRKS